MSVSSISAVCLVKKRRRRRSYHGARWQPAEIIGQHESGQLILREVERFWPGIWLAERADVRLSGPEFAIPLSTRGET